MLCQIHTKKLFYEVLLFGTNGNKKIKCLCILRSHFGMTALTVRVDKSKDKID